MEKMDGIKVMGYCRVSSPQQEKDGASLSMQQNKIREYVECHLSGADIVWIFDVVSGKNIKKQYELDRFLSSEFLQSHFTTILVYHSSRLTRNLKQGVELIESLQGLTNFVSVSEGLDSRFDLQGWKDGLKQAEEERILLGKRIKDGFEEKKRLGGCYLGSGIKTSNSMFAPFERRYVDIPFPHSEKDAFIKVPKLFITQAGKDIATIISGYVYNAKSEPLYKLFSELQENMPIHETQSSIIAYSVTRKLLIVDLVHVLKQWNPSIHWSAMLVSRLLLWKECSM